MHSTVMIDDKNGLCHSLVLDSMHLIGNHACKVARCSLFQTEVISMHRSSRLMLY